MKDNILLVYGGNSVEHEISIVTALQVKEKYKGKYNLIPCYLKNNRFYIDKKLNDLAFYKKRNCKLKHEIFFKSDTLYVKSSLKKIRFSGVMLIVHGYNCEDGTLYSFFKTLNIPVIGENLYSAVIGQDKVLAKTMAKVETLPFSLYDDSMPSAIDYPIIIKPTRLGSSVGIKVANNEDELQEKIKEVNYFTKNIIIEKKLADFTEYNIALFKYNDDFIISSIEKVSNSKVLTYDDKYKNDKKSMEGQKREIPAIIDDTLKELIINTAKKIYNNLYASLIVRIDFLYDNKTNKLYFNEINNIPGSLSLYLFKEIIDISELIDKYISNGLKNYDTENDFICSYDDNIFENVNFNVNLKK